MPIRLVGLLRGINVGKAKRVAMADLRALVSGLGYRDVTTLLNSGNVVFTHTRGPAGDTGSRLERAIATRLGVSCRVVVITAAELAAVVAENPLSAVATDPSRHLVAFMRNPSDRARLAALAGESWHPEALALGARVAYVWSPAGVLEGKLPQVIGKILGESVTVRNWATVMKIHALAATDPPASARAPSRGSQPKARSRQARRRR